MQNAQAVLDEWATPDDPAERCGESIGYKGKCDLKKGHPPVAPSMGWLHAETLSVRERR